MLVDETLEIREPSFGHTPNRGTQFEHQWLGESVVHEESLLAAVDQGRLPQSLKVLGCVGEGKPGLSRQGVDAPLSLGEQFEELNPMRAPDRLPNASELPVHSVFEVAMRCAQDQLINILLDYWPSSGPSSQRGSGW